MSDALQCPDHTASGWELVELMGEHCACYQTLLVLLDVQHQALVDHDLGALGATLASQEELLARILTIEERRHDLYQSVCKGVGLTETAVLSDLLDCDDLDPDLVCALQRHAGALRDVTEQAKKRNLENQMLINDALKLLDYSVEEIKQLAFQNTTYKKDSETGESSSIIMDEQR